MVVILSDERRALDSAGGQEDEVDCITGHGWNGEKQTLLSGSESPISAARQERKLRSKQIKTNSSVVILKCQIH